MRVFQVDSPWQYWVVDDFCTEEEYSQFVKESESFSFDQNPYSVGLNEQQIVTSLPTGCPPEQSEIPLPKFLSKQEVGEAESTLPEHITDDYPLIQRMFSIMKKEVNAIWTKEYWLTKKGHVCPAHRDTGQEIGLCVYIGERGEGTKIYDSNKNFVTQVEWKPNRALILPRSPNSYHGFECIKYDQRIALLISGYTPKKD